VEKANPKTSTNASPDTSGDWLEALILQGLQEFESVFGANPQPGFRPAFCRRWSGNFPGRRAQWGCPRANTQTNAETSQNGTQFHHARCDGCSVRIGGVRYKCNTCPNFDLCSGCKEKNFHAEHSFVTIADPKVTVHPAVCDSCENWIVGDRYKCSSCLDYDLCGNCIPKKDEVHVKEHQFFVAPPMPFGCGRRRCPRENSNGCKKEECKQGKEEVKKEEKTEKQEKESKEEIKVPEVQEQPKEIKLPEVKVTEKPVVEEKPLTPFEIKLKQLEEIGFGNRDLNIDLLVKNKADLARTIRDLLDL